jgi:hypothetical protein
VVSASVNRDGAALPVDLIDSAQRPPAWPVTAVPPTPLTPYTPAAPSTRASAQPVKVAPPRRPSNSRPPPVVPDAGVEDDFPTRH